MTTLASAGRRVPDILPEVTVTQVICDARKEWLSQPEQQQSHSKVLERPGMTRDRAKRTMTSRFRSMLKEKYGGVLWFQVLISTGSIPPRMLELANVQLAQRTLEQKHRAPASSRGPASAASAGEPIGSQHVVSVAKRQRQLAKQKIKAVREETEKRISSSYSGNHTDRKSDEEFAKLQAEAEVALRRASDGSRASGHAYKLDGQAHGAPQTSNFAILLADFCGERHINVATGVRNEVPNRPATLRNR